MAGPTEIRPTRGVTIRRLKGHDRLQIAFRYNGVECRELLPERRITKTYVDYAAGLRAEIRRKIADGTFSYGTYFPDSPRANQFEPARTVVTMGTLLRRQQALYAKQSENGHLAASTLLGYVKAIKNTLIPKWDGMGVAELSPVMLREWISTMGVTAKRVRNILIPLRSVLDDAVNDELIASSPLERIALKKLIKQTAKKSEYEVDPFDVDELAALRKAARADELALVEFWPATGLRPGEMLGLEWSHIDWVHKVARISANIVTGMADDKVGAVAKAPKTDAGRRDVELNDRALAALTAQKAYTFLAGGRVWHNPRTGEPWETDAQIRKTLWQPLCKRAGVRYRNPYQLRHTFASSLLTAGSNPFWLADQMGHVDGEMVFKIYGKWIPRNYERATRFAPNSHADEAPAAAGDVRS